MSILTIGAIAATLMAAAPLQTSVADLDGRPVDPLRASPDVRATVVVFVRTDCPISNQAAPEIERVRTQFGARGVRLWLVYLDRDESAAAIRSHAREYGLGARAIRDPDHILVRQTGVRVTPEAVIYVHESDRPRLVYRGRLDDRVASLGQARVRATRFDLRDAIAAALDGRAPSLVTTTAVGCEIADLR